MKLLVTLLLIVLAAVLQAEEMPRVAVSVAPARIQLSPEENWVPAKYVFQNSSTRVWQVTERSAFFHAFEGRWQSEPVGPIPMGLPLPAGAETAWEDKVWMDPRVALAAQQAGALPGQELLLVQSFTLQAEDGEKTHASTTLVFRLPAVVEVRALERPHYRVTYAASLESDPAKRKRLDEFLDFAEAAYGKLAEVLGYTPTPERKVSLRILHQEGSPYYQAAEGGYLNIPINVLLDQHQTDWISVAYPHELTHYFLLEAFPHPPRWFVEGPASFFGNKVSKALQREQTTEADRSKILGWGLSYEERQLNFLFEATWPKEEGGALGMGRAYRLCQQIEELGGADYFVRAFRFLRESHFAFVPEASEQERTTQLVAALQTQTSADLWALFASTGFQP